MKMLLSRRKVILTALVTLSCCACEADPEPQASASPAPVDQGLLPTANPPLVPEPPAQEPPRAEGEGVTLPPAQAGEEGQGHPVEPQGGEVDQPTAGQVAAPSGGQESEQGGAQAEPIAGETAGATMVSPEEPTGGEPTEAQGGEPAGGQELELAGAQAGDPTGGQAEELLGEAFSSYADENWGALKEVSLSQISGGTDCATFISAALREFGFDVWAVYTDGLAPGDRPEQTLAYRLFELGFTRNDDPLQLRAGDICFSQDAYFEGVEAIECAYEVSRRDGWFPTHAYIFMEWELEGSTAWAWVVDNQGQRHLRNMTVAGPKDLFQYFMRY